MKTTEAVESPSAPATAPATRMLGKQFSRLAGSRDAHKELELELIHTQMAQKPMLRAEVCARALRASQNVINSKRAAEGDSRAHVGAEGPRDQLKSRAQERYGGK
jgi:hypothetical protein